MARHDHSVPSVPGYIVWDTRNGHVIPAVGMGEKPTERVYDREAAIKTVVALNCFVLKNTDITAAKLVAAGEADLVGPFVMRPAEQRKKLTGKVSPRPSVEVLRRPQQSIRQSLSDWADKVEARGDSLPQMITDPTNWRRGIPSPKDR